MKNLLFILRRINQVELAKRLDITKANITAWKVKNKVPLTKVKELKVIKEDLKHVPKRRTVLL